MSLIVRRMRTNELETCAALYARVVDATFTWLDPGDSVAVFRHAAGEESIFVAEVDGRILGLAGFYAPEDFLHSLYIDEGFQGRGVGLALLRHVDDIATTPISLKVQVLNLRARRFYAREGFRVVEEGGEDLPSNDRWLRLARWASPQMPTPSPKLEFAMASPAQVDLCAKLYARVAARLFVWEPPDARTAASKASSFDGEVQIVATEHGVFAGFASIDVAAAQVSSLFVEPQQSGTGRALLKAAGDLIGRPFTLDCDLRNLMGLSAYERMGFSRESQISSHGFAMARLRSPKTLAS